MHYTAICAAVAFSFLNGVAWAAGPGEFARSAASANAEAARCTPPNDTQGRSCALFNRMIHASFTSREIGVLFGTLSVYPEGITGNVVLERRYRAWLREYEAARATGLPAEAIAVK